MIFAEIKYNEHYADFHEPLLKHVKSKFKQVDSGHQCDSWIWIYEGDHKVMIDTFSSMNHQVKSEKKENPLVQKVIDVLKEKYNVIIFSDPELEAHEE